MDSGAQELSRRQVLGIALGGGLGLGLARGGIAAMKEPVTSSSLKIWRRPERSPSELRDLGFDPEGIRRLESAFKSQIEGGRHPGAQLALYRDGRLVLELAAGVARRAGPMPVTGKTLFVLFSATKAWAATAAHILIEREKLALEARVADYWPEFAKHGKGKITVHQALSHRGGYPMTSLPTAPETTPAKMIEETPLSWEPGTANGYHASHFGYTVAELVRRIDGRELPEFLQQELFSPLGLADSYLGLPADRADLEARVAYVYPMEQGSPGSQFTFGFDIENPPVPEWGFVWNRPEVHQMVMPSGGGIATAHDFARFFGMLANGGSIDDVRILRRETIERAIERTNSPGEADRRMVLPVAWGLGLILGGVAEVPSYGATSTPRSFGHAGAGCTVGWGDLESGIGVAYLTNGNLRFVPSLERTGELGDIIRAAAL